MVFRMQQAASFLSHFRLRDLVIGLEINIPGVCLPFLRLLRYAVSAQPHEVAQREHHKRR